MKITVISVGKIKEKFYKDAIEEYSKRLSRYTKLEIVEVKDEKTKEEASSNEIILQQSVEAERIFDKIPKDSYVVALAIEGQALDSLQLASMIKDLQIKGESNITFIIGGSTGLHQDVLKRADFKLSFSKMTFPHQMMRVILLEQTYRSFRIINNEPYHK